MLKRIRVGQDAFVTCGSKLWHVSRKLIAGGLIALTSGVLLNMMSTDHGYFKPLLDAVDDFGLETDEPDESEESSD